MTVAALVLAAGASTRLGQPKQLVILQGESLLARTIRVAREVNCSPIVVILGANAALIQQRCSFANVTILLNHQWQEGMASSIRLGIQYLKDLSQATSNGASTDQATGDGAILLTCDMPAVTSTHLRALAATCILTASRYAGRNGVPAFFPPSAFSSLLTLTGDQGARTLLAGASSISLQDGELDIDNPEDLTILQSFPSTEGAVQSEKPVSSQIFVTSTSQRSKI